MDETDDTATLTVIDQAITDVRNGFFRRLGIDRSLAVQAISFVENPTDQDGWVRSTANTTEFYWVLRTLLCILPTMFLETAHAIQNAFDDVPLTRDSEHLQKFIRCLDKQVDVGLGVIDEPQDNCAGSPQSFSTGRTEPFILACNHPGRGFRVP